MKKKRLPPEVSFLYHEGSITFDDIKALCKSIYQGGSK